MDYNPRIINLLHLYNGVPVNLHSFIIEDEQLSDAIIDEVVSLFLNLISDTEGRDLTEDEIEEYSELRYYDNQNGTEYNILWSN